MNVPLVPQRRSSGRSFRRCWRSDWHAMRKSAWSKSARGRGKRVRDAYAKCFARHFTPDTDVPMETPRREVLPDSLTAQPRFATEPADGLDRVELASLDFFSTGDGFCRFERRGDDETLHQFLDRRFGGVSPLNASGWIIIGATLLIRRSTDR